MFDEIESAGTTGGPMELRKSNLTLRDGLVEKNKELNKKIEINNELMKLLDENPAIERFMNLSRGILR